MFEHSTNGTSRDARAAAGVRRTSPRPLGPATGLLQRFSGEARGTTAVLFALSAVPLFAVIGASMDYAQALRARRCSRTPTS